MKNFRLSAVTILTGLLASGCSDLLVDNYRYGTIEVQAWLEGGEPAVGVDLLLYQNTKHLAYGKTNAEGEYTFRFAPNGSLGVMAFLAPHFSTDVGGSGDHRDQIEVPDGRVVEVVFSRLKMTGDPASALSVSDDLPGLQELRDSCRLDAARQGRDAARVVDCS